MRSVSSNLHPLQTVLSVFKEPVRAVAAIQSFLNSSVASCALLADLSKAFERVSASLLDSPFRSFTCPLVGLHGSIFTFLWCNGEKSFFFLDAAWLNECLSLSGRTNTNHIAVFRRVQGGCSLFLGRLDQGLVGNAKSTHVKRPRFSVDCCMALCLHSPGGRPSVSTN